MVVKAIRPGIKPETKETPPEVAALIDDIKQMAEKEVMTSIAIVYVSDGVVGDTYSIGDDDELSMIAGLKILDTKVAHDAAFEEEQ